MTGRERWGRPLRPESNPGPWVYGMDALDHCCIAALPKKTECSAIAAKCRQGVKYPTMHLVWITLLTVWFCVSSHGRQIQLTNEAKMCIYVIYVCLPSLIAFEETERESKAVSQLNCLKLMFALKLLDQKKRGGFKHVKGLGHWRVTGEGHTELE